MSCAWSKSASSLSAGGQVEQPSEVNNSTSTAGVAAVAVARREVAASALSALQGTTIQSMKSESTREMTGITSLIFITITAASVDQDEEHGFSSLSQTCGLLRR